MCDSASIRGLALGWDSICGLGLRVLVAGRDSEKRKEAFEGQVSALGTVFSTIIILMLPVRPGVGRVTRESSTPSAVLLPARAQKDPLRQAPPF